MRTAEFRIIALLTSVLSSGILFGMQLRVHGTVTRFSDREPLSDAHVKIYKNGVRQHDLHTTANGQYGIVLDNGAEYVIRFSAAGRVTKSYALDTRGAEWEGDRRIQDLEIEMTLFEPIADIDFSWFDMPMGMARFDPMTGHVAWSADYARKVKPEADRLMAEVRSRMEVMASVDDLRSQ